LRGEADGGWGEMGKEGPLSKRKKTPDFFASSEVGFGFQQYYTAETWPVCFSLTKF